MSKGRKKTAYSGSWTSRGIVKHNIQRPCLTPLLPLAHMNVLIHIVWLFQILLLSYCSPSNFFVVVVRKYTPMYKWMIMVLPFSREQARGKSGSQDRFLQTQVAECLRIRMLYLNISQGIRALLGLTGVKGGDKEDFYYTRFWKVINSLPHLL